QVLVEREALGHVADPAADRLRLLAHVETVHPGLALRGGEQATEDPDERGLAGAVGAEEAVDLAAVDAQGDLVQGAHLAEVARDGAYLDAVLLAHGRSCTVAAMPGLSSPVGSISTFTPNTRSLRW